MKVKLADIINSMTDLRELNAREDIPITISMGLALASKAVEGILEVFDAKQRSLVGKYTTVKKQTVEEKDKDGNVTSKEVDMNMFNDDAAKDKYNSEINKLFDEEVEVVFNPAKISDFPKDFIISPNKMIMLSWLFTAE